MNIRIDIRFVDFNSEWHADVCLSHNKIEYISCNNIDGLMQEIKRIIMEYKHEN